MNLSLKNKNALVCGSSAGIGKASAMEMASLGATITLLARNEEKLKSVLGELPTSEGQNHNYLWPFRFRQVHDCKCADG